MLNKMDLPQADPDARASRDRGRHRHRRRRRDPVQRQDRHGHRRDPRGRRRTACRRRAASRRAAARDDRRLLVRQLRRRRDAGARRRRRARTKGERIRMMATDAVYGAEQLGVFTPKSVARERLSAGEVGFVIAGIKELQAAKVGDTITLEKKLPNNAGVGHRGAARLQGNPAAGVRRPVPDRSERVRPAARRAREAQAQRLVAALRARGQPGARLRLPLRLPRPAAHGDRAGAARARVRPGPDHHRADRGLRGRAERRRRDPGREPVEDARPGAHRRDPRADRHRAPVHAAGLRRPGDDAGQPEARRADQHGVPRPPGDADLRDAAGRDRARLLRQAEERLARLRVDGLRVQGVPRAPTSSRSTS